jgi:hypothetical protein
VTAPPPWVLQCRVVTITLPQAAVVAVSLLPRVPVVLRWPPLRVTGHIPPAPGVIRLAAPPQGPWRLPLPQGHPLRNTVLPVRRW